MPHKRQTRSARRLLRSRFQKDSIPKPVGLGLASWAIKHPSSRYQGFFKYSSRNRMQRIANV
jgi:hypothetical protein